MAITIDGITYTRAMTHAGTFHSDDVFASALILLCDPEMTIERTMDPTTVTQDTLVFDTGGGKFDHHNMQQKTRQNGVAYSSFGLLWKELGPTLCHEADVKIIDNSLVQQIDLNDNTGKYSELSMLIADIQSTEEDRDEGFRIAVDLAKSILERRIASLTKSREGMRKVRRQIKQQNDPDVLILDEWVAGWWRAVRETNVKVCVFPSDRGGWAAQGVKKDETSGEVIAPFPKGWRGKSDNALAKASGIPTATFCHRTGFIASATDKSDAIRMAKIAVKSREDRIRKYAKR
jgi:uncharacterized UPF0160 family protein